MSSSSTTAAAAAAGNESSIDIDDIDVAENLRLVRESIQKAAAAASQQQQQQQQSIRLVAVSKTKPVALLQKAYQEGNCRIFGENYVQELVEKVPQMPSDVTWHFIGALQSNKANMLLNAFNDADDLSSRLVVETVDKMKLANKLNNAAANKKAQVKIFVQVNTSGEDSKSGCEPTEVVDLCRQITTNCPHLQLVGLMTIGAPGDVSCFDTLVTCRDMVQKELNLPNDDQLELSMGMSGDYLDAIAKGATNVRVGSTIFGARNYAK